MTTVRKSLNELTISKERLAQLEALQVADVVTSDIPELDVTFWEICKAIRSCREKTAHDPVGC